MKNILYIIAVILLGFGCTKNDSSGVGDSSGNAGQGGSMAKFSVNGNHLFLINNHQLKTFDITNASQPSLVSNTDMGFGIETVFILGENLFVGANNGMYIYDISDPSHLVKLSFYQHITSCDPVVANDSLAFVTLNSASSCQWQGGANRLDVLDIANKLNPIQLSSVAMASPKGLAINHQYLYVCNAENGVKVFDYSNPKSLSLINMIQGIDSYDVIIRNSTLFLIGDDGLYQYDITDPNQITIISSLSFHY